MEAQVYQLFSEIQTTHWWFVARRIIVEDILRRYVQSAPSWAVLPRSESALERSLRIADIGCGTGGMLPMLAQFGEVWGVDSSAIAVELCRQKNLPNVYRADDPAWRQSQFDVLTFFDVLEHVDDDAGFLGDYVRQLKPGGLVVITVPALMFLWSEHDRVNHHRRRYAARQLRAMVENAALLPRKVSYFNTWLFPAIAIVRLAVRFRDYARTWTGRVLRPRMRPHPYGPALAACRDGRTDFERNIGFLNGLLKVIFASERFVLRYGSFPLGTSLICLAHKPGSYVEPMPRPKTRMGPKTRKGRQETGRYPGGR